MTFHQVLSLVLGEDLGEVIERNFPNFRKRIPKQKTSESALPSEASFAIRKVSLTGSKRSNLNFGV
jgi:hypothetical protein